MWLLSRQRQTFCCSGGGEVQRNRPQSSCTQHRGATAETTENNLRIKPKKLLHIHRPHSKACGEKSIFFFRDCKREERCSSPSGDLIMKACYLETEVLNRTHYATDCTSSADSPSNSKAHIQILWQKQTVVWDLPWTRRNAWALL